MDSFLSLGSLQALTPIGIAFWSIALFSCAIALEGSRRLSRAYDRKLSRYLRRRNNSSISSNRRPSRDINSPIAENTPFVSSPFPEWEPTGSDKIKNKLDGLVLAGSGSPTWPQHVVRACLHALQFGIAFFIMIVAMETYWNGYVLIFLVIGSIIGHLVFARDTSPTRPNFEFMEQ